MSKRDQRGTCDCLKIFDFYKDLPRGLAQPTLLGASMSTSMLLLLGSLIFYQVAEFLSYQKTSEMLIDSAQTDIYVSSNTPNHKKRVTYSIRLTLT